MCGENVVRRFTYIGDAAAGHAADAGQCADALFLRVFHLWHRRCPTVGRATAQPMLPRLTRQHLCPTVSQPVACLSPLRCLLAK